MTPFFPLFLHDLASSTRFEVWVLDIVCVCVSFDVDADVNVDVGAHCLRCSSTSMQGARTWDALPSSSGQTLCLRLQVKRQRMMHEQCVFLVLVSCLVQSRMRLVLGFRILANGERHQRTRENNRYHVLMCSFAPFEFGFAIPTGEM